MTNLLTQPLILSFLISLLATPLVIKIFKKNNWLDDPKKNKHPKVIHQKPLPRGGGISVFLAVLLTATFFLPLDKHLAAILLAALLTTIVGVIDDLKDLSPYWRFLTNLLAALIIILGGIGISYITNPFDTVFHLDQFYIGSVPILKIGLTLFWLVWCMNIVGWSGGVDGQLPGFVSISAVIIGLLSLRFSQDITQWPVIALSGTVAGSYLGLLVFNAYPQKIIPGYSGKSLAGLMLGTLAILSGAKLNTAILVLALPMIDGGFIIIRRILKKKSPVWGDAQHLHHLLLKIGVPKPRIALFYWIFSLILGLIVLNLNSKQKLYFLAMAIIAIGAGVLVLEGLIKKKRLG
ncbi:MAG: MraY family glycosyltransferase [Candidatus Shapirobacteria bacterium]